MKNSRNLVGITCLLLLLMACQPTTTTIELSTATFIAPSDTPTPSRIVATAQPTVVKEEGNETPIELSTATLIAPLDIPTPLGIMATVQPTIVKDENNEFDGVQSMLLFQLGNEEGGILNVDSGEVHYFDDQRRLYSWSPSGKQLLFSMGEDLYIADADGSNPRLAYDEGEINTLSWPAGFTPTDFKGFWLAQWLTDDIVLLSFTTIDYAAPLNPFLYSLDVDQGSLNSIDLDNWHVILNISPDGTFWLQGSENGIQLATIDGKNTPVWPDFFDTGSGFLPNGPSLYPILPDGGSFVFDACFEFGQNCHIFRATIVNLEILTIEPIFPTEPYHLENLQISPDGQYLAFVQSDDFLYIINLRSNTLVFKLPWNEIYSPAQLFWSPDSQTLAYASATSDGHEIKFGINGINIETGEISVITNTRTAVHLLDWRYMSQPTPPYR